MHPCRSVSFHIPDHVLKSECPTPCSVRERDNLQTKNDPRLNWDISGVLYGLAKKNLSRSVQRDMHFEHTLIDQLQCFISSIREKGKKAAA